MTTDIFDESYVEDAIARGEDSRNLIISFILSLREDDFKEDALLIHRFFSRLFEYAIPKY